MAQRRVQDGTDERPVAFAERPIGRIAVFMIESAVERQLAVNDGGKNFCRRSAGLQARLISGRALSGGLMLAEWLLRAV
jgi:hypothetical protein